MPNATPSRDTIFCEAIEIADAADRAAYLARACGGDDALRQRVAALVAAHFRAGGILDRPADTPDVTADIASDPEALGTVIGPYKLLERIGEGGMGVVYVAEQTEPVRRRVALKVIKPGMDTKEVVARFEAERQALAMMDHPNIAKVHDGGTTPEGRPYFVMEFVKGRPITEYCDKHRLTARQRLGLFVKVCSAVHHAHQKGIIHRDIKPSNVLVSLHDVDLVVKVIDFGIAKATCGPLTDKTVYTAAAQMIGTPLYMSPEQAGLSDLDVDTRSDVYSLGVLLYELLTGTTPFDSETLKKAGYDEMRRIIREDEPPKPSARLSTMHQGRLSTLAEQRGQEPRRLCQQVRGELDWIVMRALEKDRNRRYESASAFGADVERYLHDEPVQACPPSVAYRLRKFARRHRVAVSLAAGFVVAASAFGITVAWLEAQKAALRGQVESEAKLALRDADLLQGQKKWAEAAAAVKRAQGLLGTGPTSEAVKKQVEQRAADLTLVAELEQIFMDRLGRLADRYWSDLADPEIDSRYARAFRDAGIDVQGLDIAMTAALIRQRDVQAELAAALDHWSSVRFDSSGENDPFWRQLRDLANAVDPEPFRVLLRKAISWKELNEEDSKRIETAKELLDQPLPVLMAHAMPLLLVPSNSGGRQPWVDLLLALHRRHPEDFWINYELGTNHPDPVEALRFSTAAVAIRPKNSGAHLLLGNVLHGRGRLDDAILSYEEAIRLKPDQPEPYHSLGTALSDKGRYDEAIASFREALLLRQSYAPAHLNLGVALARKGHLDQAASSFSDAIRLTVERGPGVSGLRREDLATAHRNLGVVLGKQEKWEEAIRALREAIRLKANDAYSRNVLAWFLATCPIPSLRDPKQAVRHAEQAAALTLNDGQVWNTLGAARVRNGEWKAAVAALTKSQQLRNGGDSADFFFLAMAHWQLGEKPKAREWYDKGVQWMERHAPKDEEIRRFRAEAAEQLQLVEAKPKHVPASREVP